MRRRVIHSLIGLSLLAAVLAAPQTTAGAQGWTGFTAVGVPSGLQGGGPNDSPGWGAGITHDLGGAGVDIWVNNHAERSEGLEDFTPGSNTFVDATLSPLMGTDSHGVTFTDFDGDGDDDLVEISGRDHDNRLFRNDGGDLSLVPTNVGVEDNRGRGRQALMVDIDNDGDMDMFIGNLDRTLISEEDPPNPDDPAPSELYLNNGDGTSWTKVADPGTVLNDGSIRFLHLTRAGIGTDPVVITSNTFAFAIDSIATGSATLTTAATPINTSTGVANNLSHARDFALGDLDGDLMPEFVVARQDDFLSTDDDMDMNPDLLGELALGIGQVSTSALTSRNVVDISDDALVDNCRSVAIADYDNDGDLDIFGGCTMAESGQDTNVILLNDGAGNFSIGSGLVPTTAANTASVVIAADFNEDGWMDTYVGTGYDSQAGPDTIFLNNGGNGNHWLTLELVDPENPDVMGAQVFVGTDDWQVRETGHRAHQGQDTKLVHFGLGSATAIAPIEIMWPDGTFETCTIENIDSLETITKGGSTCAAGDRQNMIDTINAAPVIDDEPDPDPGPFCKGVQVTVDLNMGEVPTAGNDVILGTPGNDLINAGAGNDRICGGDGNDIINAGDGNDRVFGELGNDTLNGERGRDVLIGDAGDDVMDGGKNNDRVLGNGGRDTIFGGNGRDVLKGNNGNDTIYGGGGNDRMDGGNATDTGFGQIGDDFCANIEDENNCEFDL